MAFQFPNAPSEGQFFKPTDSITYVYRAPAWKILDTSGTATIWPAPPANPNPGDLWWESDTGDLFVWYQDADSAQWVQISASATGAGSSGAALSPEDYGAAGDGVADDYLPLQDAINAMAASRTVLRLTSGKTYLTSAALVTNADFVNISGDGSPAIKYAQASGTALSVGASRAAVATKTLTGNAVFGGKVLTLDSTAGVLAGAVGTIKSTKAWYNDPRDDGDITSNPWGYTLAGGTTTTAILPATFAVTNPSLMVGKTVTFTVGPHAGYARRVTAYDNTTKIITFTPALASAVDVGERYTFPEAVKGQTVRVGRVIDATSIELVDTLTDGYYVADAAPANIREEVTVSFYPPYTPVLTGFSIDGVPAGPGESFGLAISRAVDTVVKVKAGNFRRAGVSMSACHGGGADIEAIGISDNATGYGAQLYGCAKVSITGSGWHNRRLFDISGTTPSDDCRVHDVIVTGGGLTEDGVPFSIGGNGVGTHGPARNTVYESCQFSGLETAIYERGRGAIVRNCRFGADVQVPVFMSFGGRLEVYGNVCDAGVYSDVEPAGEWNETSGAAAYARCLVGIGANLVVSQPDSSIVVRDNIVRSSRAVIELNRTGTGTIQLPNLSVYDNDVEFFPPTTADDVSLFARGAGSTTNLLNVAGRMGPNRMRTAAANKQPLFSGSADNIGLYASVNVPMDFGGGGTWTMRLNDDTAWFIPVAEKVRNKILVSVAAEETALYHFFGWVLRDSTAGTALFALSADMMATAPTGTDGTDGRLQLHFGSGKLTIGNRTGGARNFTVVVFQVG